MNPFFLQQPTGLFNPQWVRPQQPVYGMRDAARPMYDMASLPPMAQEALQRVYPRPGNLQAINRTPGGMNPALWEMIQKRFPQAQQRPNQFPQGFPTLFGRRIGY